MKQRLHQLVTVLAVTASLTLSGTASAHGHRPPLWTHGFEEIRSVTPTTVLVKHQSGLEQKLSKSHLSVQAAMYPATPTILRPGEHITVFQEAKSPPLVVIHPAAYGTLQKAGVMWAVKTHRHGTVAISGASPRLLGMTAPKPGQKVMVFGSTGPNNKVDAAAMAAPPLMTRSTVENVGVGQLTLKSDRYGTLNYPLGSVPAAFRDKLSALERGDRVIAGLDPLSRRVLMVWPDHVDRWARTLERGTAGQIVAVSPKDLTLTNRLGTVTVVLDQNVQLEWPGHKDAQVSDLKPGTRIIALRHQDGRLNILVLS